MDSTRSSFDPANGYDAIAAQFQAVRSLTGAAIVRAWASTLPRGGAVLDLGCGHGFPITHTLLEAGLKVWGIDASPKLLAALHGKFPDVKTECTTVESSAFFDRKFDGIVAWGLIFLLMPDNQTHVLRKAARALQPGGSFLFTAPHQACSWPDVLTGRPSVSLGANAYGEILQTEGLTLQQDGADDGGNHYFMAAKPV